jgi:CheY-like chemotaxis protein
MNLSNSTAMLITPLLGLSYAYAVADFSKNKARASYQSARPFYITLTEENTNAMSVPAILYVEDNNLLRHAVKDILEQAGWHVESCADVGIALGLMTCRTHYNLLLIDNELPSITGLELTRRARQIKHLQDTPIILISLQDLATQAHLAGATAFLRKPNNLVQLLDTIRHLLALPDKK